MSLRDYCIPDPPIECPRCDGILTGWETRNEGSFLFVWRQGIAAPIDHEVDSDFAVNPERLAELRLPHEFTIIFGECSRCGYHYRGDVHCTTDELKVWRTVEFAPPPLEGIFIEPGWLQCPECCDVFELRSPKLLYTCSEKHIVRYTPSDKERRA
jgi:hypothetical protein